MLRNYSYLFRHTIIVYFVTYKVNNSFAWNSWGVSNARSEVKLSINILITKQIYNVTNNKYYRVRRRILVVFFLN